MNPSAKDYLNASQELCRKIEKATPQEKALAYGSITVLLDSAAKMAGNPSPQRLEDIKSEVFNFCFLGGEFSPANSIGGLKILF